MKVRVYLDNIEINDPINLAELEIELNFDRDDNTEAVSINDWVLGVSDKRFPNDGAVLANKHIDNGLIGGVGVFEGMPLRIDLDDQKTKIFNLFDGYLDLSRALVLCDQVTAPAVSLGIDHFNKVADSITYATLFEDGKITKNDAIAVPYVINKKVNAGEVIIAIVSIYVLTQEVAKQILQIGQWTANTASVLNAIGGVLSLILQIIYLATLFIALVKLILDLFNMLVQPVKYHMGMYVKDSIRIGLAEFGYTLSSSVLETPPFNELLILPEKYNLKEDNTGPLEAVAGFFTPNVNEQFGFFKGTPGDLIRLIQETFHLKAVIEGTIFHLEKQDFQIQSPIYQLPPIEDPGHEFNRDEFIANLIIAFSVDFQDRNTIQEYLNTAVQVATLPVSIINRRMVTLDGLVPATIQASLGKRKTELNTIEKILDLFLKAIGATLDLLILIVNAVLITINNVVDIINKVIKALKVVGIDINFQIPNIPTLTSPDLGGLIEDRIDMLKMETDFINVPKMILVPNNSNPRNNKLSPGNEQFLNAPFLYNNFHFFKSFIGQNGDAGNQHLIKNVEKIPLCFDDFQILRTNNRLIDSEGNEGEWITLKFNPINQTATGTYKIREVYTNNLRQQINIPNGK